MVRSDSRFQSLDTCDGIPGEQALPSRGGTRLVFRGKYVLPLCCGRLRVPAEQEYEQGRFIINPTHRKVSDLFSRTASEAATLPYTTRAA